MFAKLIRRTHMYLALFLAPWVLMYALSTMAMNHHHFVRGLYGGDKPPFKKERELAYEPTFPTDATPQTMARQILADLDLDGRHRVRGQADHGPLTILRLDPVNPQRILYLPTEKRVVVEKQESRIPNVLARLHLRQSYRFDYAFDDTWAFSVDLVIAAMVFWAASGLWLWWELKATRRWGAVSIVGGIGLFTLFLCTI